MNLSYKSLLDVTRWLSMGERGTSSEAIVSYLVHGYVPARDALPKNMQDFRRCELLLQQVPALRSIFERMGSISPEWARLAEHWDEIKSTLEHEVPGIWDPKPDGHAPRATALIRALVSANNGKIETTNRA
ncbi:hypothetical protein [Glutamicibacter sp. TV12E]|uniref:hypothetical protein n=1 Tax=Glutamicibacter sp. TV12E TaxID=3446362 RepID=UPI0040331CF6